ncbi:MAG: GGDEF domain-containing protein [Luteimonas sp.]
MGRKVPVRDMSLLFLLALLIGAPALVAAQSSIGMLLGQAEIARSTDPVRFQQDLRQLNAGMAQATPRQQQQIAYLNAYAQIYASHFDQGIHQAKQLIAATADISLKFRAGALIVNAYALNGQFNEGLHQLEQTLSLIGRVDDPELRQHGLVSGALLYSQIGQFQLARHYAETIMAKPASPHFLCGASYVEFDALLHEHRLPRDDGSLVQAIDECIAKRESLNANLMRVTLARKWMELGKRDQAITYLRNHLEEVQATHYPRLIAEVHSLLGELLYAKGDMEGAQAEASLAVAQGAGILNAPPLVAAYKTLYQIAESQHDIAGALAYYKQFAEADKGYLNEVKTREMAYQIVRNENQQKNQQIELLNRQNSLLQLQQQVDRASAQNSRLLMLLASILALFIGLWAYKTRRLSASLRLMAETDALTEVCNRHHFTRQSELCLNECAAASEQAALIMFDLDHFKTINDSYGHVTGDWVLKAVANTCNGLCRKMDKVGRLGGEEFAILIHGADLKSATRMAEDCRVRLSQIDSRPSGYSFPITASFGVSSTAMSGYHLDKLLSHADQMLYRAKREGRNLVRAYIPDLPMETTEPKASNDSSAMPEGLIHTPAGAIDA